MTAYDGFWWVVLPYASMAICVLGHVWRYRYDQFGWTSYSTELQEHRWLKWGAPLFHYGAFAAIIGHILGLLIPEAATDGMGISDETYHLFSGWAGFIAAVVVLLGMFILAGRRILSPRVRATTIPVDWVALIALGIVVGLGISATIRNFMIEPYDYRKTISIWFRGLFWAHPHVALAADAPWIYRLHAVAAWGLFAIWPFTRLVHVWSLPITYLWRPLVVYRRRKARAPNEPGTANRKWRKYGVRF